MYISGLQKTTLLDFPEKISAIVFTPGCNFRCPYCHNPQLVHGNDAELLDLSEVFDFLHKRRNVLQGVVVTGGEPTLQTGLAEFCTDVKKLGYAVKLDTNGSHPDVLEHLLSVHAVDYIAMDLKAIPVAYPEVISPQPLGTAIVDSIRLLESQRIPHEFRIPCALPFVTPVNINSILASIQPDTLVYLQKIRLGNVLSPDFFQSEGRPNTDMELQILQQISSPHNCRIR